MSEDYRIIGPPRGEPRSRGDVGARVRVRLSGHPSRRWARDLGAQLTKELVGHPGTAHLCVNVDELVQGDELVLDGIEDRETLALAGAIRRAVDAANQAVGGEAAGLPNLSQGKADLVAAGIPLDESESAHGASTDAGADPPCPRCGEPVSLTAGDRAAGDQLAVREMACPKCGTRLARDVQGHADHGWRAVD